MPQRARRHIARAGAVAILTWATASPALTGFALAAPTPAPGPASPSVTATVQGPRLTVRGILDQSPTGQVDVLVDETPIGRLAVVEGRCTGALPLPAGLPGGEHAVALRLVATGEVVASTTITTAVPSTSRLELVTVRPTVVRAGGSAEVTARLVDRAGRPVPDTQLSLDAPTPDGFRSAEATDADGRARLRVEIPRGTPPGTLRLQLRFHGDDLHTGTTAPVTITVQPGGLSSVTPTPLPPPPPATTEAPAPGPTVIVPPSRTAAPAPRPAHPRSRWALPVGVKVALAGFGFLGLVVGLAAGATVTTPRRRDDTYDRLIADVGPRDGRG